MSYKFKDIEVNWEIIYHFLYMFLVNISHKILHLWKTANWKLNDLDLTYQGQIV